jgi:hypothetical protein
MLRDIRDHIPRTAQTDPNKYPPYVFRPYPKMMVDEHGKPFKNKDGSNVIVQSEAEEHAFKGAQPEPIAAKTIVATPLEKLAPAQEVNTLQEKRKPGRPPLPKNLD